MLICYMLVDVADCALNVVLKSCSDFCPEAHSSRIWAMSSAQMSSLATKLAADEITIDEYRMFGPRAVVVSPHPAASWQYVDTFRAPKCWSYIFHRYSVWLQSSSDQHIPSVKEFKELLE